MPRPLIGITVDVADYDWHGQPRPRAQSALTYSRAVAEAGGLPMLLAPIASLAREHAQRCDAIVMTGGDDPRMELFDPAQPTHPRAKVMHPLRQEYEQALLRALDELRQKPTLGICLGMQMMSLHNGARYDQCLDESLSTHERHKRDTQHAIKPLSIGAGPVGLMPAGLAASNHNQAVTDPGRLRTIALSDDGLIEAVDDPTRPFYLGVQWHPERTADPNLGRAIFERLVAAARR